MPNLYCVAKETREKCSKVVRLALSFILHATLLYAETLLHHATRDGVTGYYGGPLLSNFLITPRRMPDRKKENFDII